MADRVADKDTSLGKDADTPAQRRATLKWCLNNPWAETDIKTIGRVDTTKFHGWEMTPLK